MTKSKYLLKLEDHLRKELQILKAPGKGAANDSRLQAHREVFDNIIENFKTYQPMLASIKREYELMVSHLKQEINKLTPLKKLLFVVSEECDKRIMAAKQQERAELRRLREENNALTEELEDSKQAEQDLQLQVKRLQKEVGEEYQRYRDESDARRLLLIDIAQLRQESGIQKQATTALDKTRKRDDPVTLRLALKKAREDEALASKKLSDIMVNYSDVAPRKELETAEQKVQDLETEMKQLTLDMRTLKDEHELLLEKYNQVLEQRDEFYMECEQLRRSATPRPDWDSCGEHIDGGLMRWKEMSMGKTSQQLVQVLLGQISGVSDKNKATRPEDFQGRGTGESIPLYLRHEGPVRNRELGKRDCALIIKDIWQEKAEQEGQGKDGRREKLSSFVYYYLERRFPTRQMAVEWAYNLQDACQRYSSSHQQIAMFWNILNDMVDEDVFLECDRQVSRLLRHLESSDDQSCITSSALQALLSKMYPSRSDRHIQRLMAAAHAQLGISDEDQIPYSQLFEQDDEGRHGAFVTELMQQEEEEKIKYIEDIQNALGSSSTTMSSDDLKMALTLVEPDIDPERLTKYLCWAFRVSPGGLIEAKPRPVISVLERLYKCNLKKARN